MTLQSSGAISMSDINLEQGNLSTRNVGLNTLAQEWYTQTGKTKFNTTTNIAISLWYGETWGSPPAAPSDLAGTYDMLTTTINLSWTDNADNEDGFILERIETGAPDWVQIADLAPDTTTYSDSTVNTNTEYTYRLHAYNSVGNSATVETAPIAT